MTNTIIAIIIADVLSQDSGECVICLEDLLAGKRLMLHDSKNQHKHA